MMRCSLRLQAAGKGGSEEWTLRPIPRGQIPGKVLEPYRTGKRMQARNLWSEVRDQSWKTPPLWAPKLGLTKEKREYGARDEHRSTERERCSVLAQGKPCDYGIVTL